MTRWAIGVVSAAFGVVAFAARPIGQGAARPPVAPGAGQAASATTGTGLIFGQVIDASSGHPISGATVTLSVRPGGGRASGAGGPAGGAARTAAVAQATLGGATQFGSPMLDPTAGPGTEREITDGQGHFVFGDLSAGTVSLSASAPGYVSGPTPRPIDLGEAERLGNVNVRLSRYGVIGGVVLDDLGEPAVGVTVRALARAMANGQPRWSPAGASVTTDDRGQFRIAALRPGTYALAVPETQVTMPVSIAEAFLQSMTSGAGAGTMVLDVMAGGGPPPSPVGVQIGDYLLQTVDSSRVAPNPPSPDGHLFEYQTTFYPGVTSIAQAGAIALASGEERTGLTIPLRLAPTLRVSGIVTGPDGPMATVGVRLVPAGADASASNTLDAATTLTAADGSFLLLGVAPGQYLARVLKQPRPQLPANLATSGLGALAFGGAPMIAPSGVAAVTLYGERPVTVGTVDVSGVALMLTPGASLSGRVQFDGAAAPPTPQQMRSVSVTLLVADGRDATVTLPGRGGAPQSNIGPDGQFKTQGYPAGQYFVTSSAVPGGVWAIASVTANGRDVLTQPLELADGDVGGVTVTFTDKTTTISGVAHAATPGTTATVIAFPLDYQTWMAKGMSPRRTRSGESSKTGAYTIRNLLPGDYLVAALDDDEADVVQDAAFFDALARVATHLTLADGEKKTLDLQIVRVK